MAVRPIALTVAILLGVACTNDYEGLIASPSGSASVGAGGGATAGSASTGGAGDGGHGAEGSSASSGDGGAAGAASSSSAGAATVGTGVGGAGGAGPGSGGGGGAAPLASCTDQYGTAPSYEGCPDVAQDCLFYTVTTSCGQFCAAHGGKCSVVYNQGSPDHCAYSTAATYDCAAVYNDMICVCSHGCGGEPACAQGKTCDGTDCL